MLFIITGKTQYQLHEFSDTATLQHSLQPADTCISSPAQLLECYVATDDNSALMPALNQIRDRWLAALDDIQQPAEIVGLIHWLLRDHEIDNRGETLEQTATRLSDLDLDESSKNDFTQILYHINDAVERLDEIAEEN